MQVETFEATEINADATVEMELEQISLIEKLGLEGQQKLLHKGDAGETSVNPYRKITKEEVFVYSTLFPKRVKLERYSDGPIPVRILQVASYVKDLNLGQLWVWCPETAREPDPILVVGGEYEWNLSDCLLLARWGECLAPWEELCKRAVEKAKVAAIEQLNDILLRVKSDIDNIQKAESIISFTRRQRSTPEYQY